MSTERQAELANELFDDLDRLCARVRNYFGADAIRDQLDRLYENYRCESERNLPGGDWGAVRCDLMLDHDGLHSGAEGSFQWEGD